MVIGWIYSVCNEYRRHIVEVDKVIRYRIVNFIIFIFK
jgi:hypothetical protein